MSRKYLPNFFICIYSIYSQYRNTIITAQKFTQNQGKKKPNNYNNNNETTEKQINTEVSFSIEKSG